MNFQVSKEMKPNPLVRPILYNYNVLSDISEATPDQKHCASRLLSYMTKNELFLQLFISFFLLVGQTKRSNFAYLSFNQKARPKLTCGQRAIKEIDRFGISVKRAKAIMQWNLEDCIQENS
jgi:hypothetical protein